MVHGVWFRGTVFRFQGSGFCGALVYGVWCMVYGVWYKVYGVWCTVYGVWCVVNSEWCIDDPLALLTSRRLLPPPPQSPPFEGLGFGGCFQG